MQCPVGFAEAAVQATCRPAAPEHMQHRGDRGLVKDVGHVRRLLRPNLGVVGDRLRVVGLSGCPLRFEDRHRQVVVPLSAEPQAVAE